MINVVSYYTSTVITGPRSRDENTSAARYRDVNKAWKLCEKQSKSIELLYEGEDGESTLAKVHFNVPESVRQNLLKSLSINFVLAE